MLMHYGLFDLEVHGGGAHLQLQLVCNEGDELGICRLALGVSVGNNSTNK